MCYLARIMLQGSSPESLRIVDLSAGGIGGYMSRAVAPGTRCVISLDAILESGTRRISVWGTIAYCSSRASEFRVGIKFLDSDTMSKAYLQQLSL